MARHTDGSKTWVWEGGGLREGGGGCVLNIRGCWGACEGHMLMLIIVVAGGVLCGGGGGRVLYVGAGGVFGVYGSG